MFNFFKKKRKEPVNSKEVLDYIKRLQRDIATLSAELENLKRESKFSIQKIGLIRFNPFKEVGGNQSFSVALLDGNDSGIVITSLYSREGNRVYGKEIKAGQSDFLLSVEEKEAINKAKNKNEKTNSKFNSSAQPKTKQ